MASAQVLPRTEVHVIHSDAVGDDFEITVLPPMPELQAGPTSVVYGTDANGGIGTYTEIVNLLLSGAEIPPVTLVGVGYPIGGDFNKWIQLRTRDFTPTVDQWQCDGIGAFSGLPIQSDGGAAFLEFLTSELRPWVAANYDVTDDATYIGDSPGLRVRDSWEAAVAWPSEQCERNHRLRQRPQLRCVPNASGRRRNDD